MKKIVITALVVLFAQVSAMPVAFGSHSIEEQKCQALFSLAGSISSVEEVRDSLEEERLKALEQGNFQRASILSQTAGEISMILFEMQYKYDEMSETINCDQFN